MLYTNLVGLIGNIAFYLVTMQLNDKENTVEKVLGNYELLTKVFVIGLCGALGQIFIYFTLSLHNAYKLGIITTSRKCVSVILSAIAFNHSFSNLQWLGVSMVLGSTIFEVYDGNRRR